MVFAMLKAGERSIDGARRLGWNCFTLPSAGTLMFTGLSTLAGTTSPRPCATSPAKRSIDLSEQANHPLSNGGHFDFAQFKAEELARYELSPVGIDCSRTAWPG